MNPRKNPQKPRFRPDFVTQALVLGLSSLLLFVSSCGKPDADNDASGAGGAGGPTYPYPNFHGGDFHGEKNFAILINNFQQGKIEPTPWAGAWWPYAGNGIAGGGLGA